MATPIHIDFVSDVSCPWCVVGLMSLERALANLGDAIEADITLQPFELNPDMPAEGRDLDEHLLERYGRTREELAPTRQAIAERGAELDFDFRMEQRDRIYNTFDAHRLLHWAEQEGRQIALKHALFRAYFTEGDNPGARDVLIRLAGEVGLDPLRAAEVLDSGEYADEVRERERFYAENGIHAVPSIVVNDQYLIQGGQPIAAYEAALRQIAARASAAT